MNIGVAWNRLSARLVKRDVHKTVGRFSTVRKTYSLLQNQRQSSNESFYQERLHPRKNSIFPELAPQKCRGELQQRSVALGLQLPSAMVHEIYDYACQSCLYEPGFDDMFKVDDVRKGCLPTGRPVLRGLVKNPQHCPAIETIAHDPKLLDIARAYLRYWPTQVTRHLTWTFVSNLPLNQQKERFLPLSYHYDVAGYNSMSAYFYITDMDARSGAHVMIERSHAQKPVHTLYAPWSGRQTDQTIWDYYGKDRELLIEGKAGLGFIQDPSCFHKLLPPSTQHRLICQIRYA